MRVVIAIDAFKGSITSLEAGNAAKRGVLRSCPDAQVKVLPLADGGEGTVDAFLEGLQAKKIDIEVSDPLGRKTRCTYGVLLDGTAVMEMSEASGITKLTDSERNPLYTSTYGVGQMIIDAIDRGCRKFVIGIGGSATNDGGMGMLCALGYEFLDESGQTVKQGAQSLPMITSVRTQNVHPLLKDCDFQIACDVNNPLCGEQGATFIYGLQKGLPTHLCQSVDEGMRHYAMVIENVLMGRECETEHKNTSYIDYPGAGAAGGLGFAFVAVLHGKLVSGVELILDTIGLEKELSNADIVITGEGRLDAQTAMGKAPIGVARRAKQHQCQAIAFAGCIGEDAEVCREKGVDAYYAIAPEDIPLDVRMQRENALYNMETVVAKVFCEMQSER
ncbi:MAG: glycerate kinase [Lachnospiraceae bacterium]|nr:glycerate kinase [Lachnospiraceae bacterium]